MIIGIEAERANNPHKTGVEHYAKQLILQLAVIDTINTYILYVRTKPEQWLNELPKNFKVKVMPFPLFWTQIRLSWEMLIHPVDVLFIPASSMPLIHPKKTVVTVHDLAFMYFPESYTWFTRNFHKFEDILVGLFAWKIIAISESTKNDLVKNWRINPKRIFVVHHGYEALQKGFKHTSTIPLPERYILFLSTLQPRKNLERLVDAFALLRAEFPELNHTLVIAGKPGWKFEGILKKIEENKKIVLYLNHVSDQDRLAIMAKAEGLVLPSLYEGFGMQILEAFSLGVPVATSRISSMPEVAENAALYFNPLSVVEIKNAIKIILLDASVKDNLIEKGYERLKYFSWNKCAKETLDVLVLEQPT